MKNFKTFLASVFFLLFSSGSMAAIMEAGFPPPGGVTYSSSGTSPSHTGGKTWSFSNFNDSAYDELYYSVKYPAMGENGTTPMTYNSGSSDLAGGVVVWNNTFNFFNAQSGQNESVNGRFTLTVTDTSNSALGLTDATSLGLDVELGGLLNVTSEFKANWLFEINDTPALVWYDAASNSLGSQLNTSVGGSFFYSPPTAVPVPAAAWLFGSALLGLAGVARRKKA